MRKMIQQVGLHVEPPMKMFITGDREFTDNGYCWVSVYNDI